jgi:hypothetical protein
MPTLILKKPVPIGNRKRPIGTVALAASRFAFLCRPIPRQTFVDPIDGVIGDAGEDVAEAGLGVEAAQLCSLDQGIDRRHPLAALV